MTYQLAVEKILRIFVLSIGFLKSTEITKKMLFGTLFTCLGYQNLLEKKSHLT
jgi:hypothetical protein